MNLALFIMAGYETTSSALALVFFLLAKYPLEQQKVFAEINEHFPYDETDLYVNNDPEFSYLENLEYMDMFIKESKFAANSLLIITHLFLLPKALRMYPIANP